jgi:hypothetical protein
MDQSEIKQKELFDKHAKLFEAHYSDKYTEKFREWFVYKYLVKDDQIILIDCIFSQPNKFQLFRENTNNLDNCFMFQRILL